MVQMTEFDRHAMYQYLLLPGKLSWLP